MFYTNQPPKLLDSRLHGAQSGAELFIVEGDSASQAVAKQRDSQFQAVLPMQGKPMNPTRVTQQKLEDNVLYAALIQAIGAGVGEAQKIEQRRYQRILLLMDPDADGIHCGALMTLFFYRWMRPLLASGCLYLVRPPVGQQTKLDTSAVKYAYTMADFRQMLASDQASAYHTLKYRGLAGIPQDSLATCCINPATRTQLPLGLKDAQMALNVFG